MVPFLEIQKDNDPKYRKLEKTSEIRSLKQLNMFKAKFRKEFGESTLFPEQDINEQ